jgi:hypothetical protein
MIPVKSTPIRLLACGLLFCMLMISLAPAAIASPQLHWNTDRVYYDSQGRIIIEGYFENTGTQTITWINWMEIWVYFRQANTNWWLQASATARDLNVTLDPGDTVRWTFRISNAGHSYFDYWNVKWNVNYKYN